MDNKDFLLEIGCEELPARDQGRIAIALADQIKKILDGHKIAYGESHTFATPRRLAVSIYQVASTQPLQEIQRQGPGYDSAYDKDGTPTLACLGFAKSCGVSTDQLEVQETAKGRRVFCRTQQEGKATAVLLPEIISSAISKLPLSKPMRWGSQEHAFVRPVKWLLCLFGRECVPMTLFGQKAGRDTYGHRFHFPKPLNIPEPRDYSAILFSKGRVIADDKARLETIEKCIQKATDNNNRPIISPALLNEVTALVEWPVALLGRFDPRFLALPREVLITSMATHLKCFPIEDNKGLLLPQFIVMSNIDSDNPQRIVHGNERVLNARLSDAEFFYQNDLKTPLEKRLKPLGHVLFQKQLGTMEDKARRLAKLAAYIIKPTSADPDITKQAALLSKCDLISEMVTEFPKLQGIMGYYYALHDKAPKKCCLAIKEHYLPGFSGDQLPSTLEGTALALADRLDTLVGILGINKQPTGDKDPYGLRRAALGILRLLIEKQLPLSLTALIDQAIKAYAVDLPNKKLPEQALTFTLNRLKAWYQEQGINSDMYEAVLACQPETIVDFHRRIEAVQKFRSLPEASTLAAANKRVSNILKKTNETIPKQVNAALFEKEAEKNLAKQLEKHQKNVDGLYQKKNYTQALSELASLKDPVDAFFDDVMIMTEDKKIRANRLALLKSLHHLFSQVADISLLQ